MARWTEDEIEILKQNYEYTPSKEIKELIPRFTMQQIRAKAHWLGLKRKKT